MCPLKTPNFQSVPEFWKSQHIWWLSQIGKTNTWSEATGSSPEDSAVGFHSEDFHSLPKDTDEMSGPEPKLSGEANERQWSFLKLARSSSQNLGWSRLQEQLHLIFRSAYLTVRKVFSALRSCAPRTESAGTNATKRLQNIRKLQPVKERAVKKSPHLGIALPGGE